MALIHALGKFKPLLEISPAVLCLVDSQVVYFLSHNNLLSTNLKAKRLGTLLHLTHPNILVAPVRGKDNVSDKLSRLFSLPRVIEETVSLKELVIPDELPEIEGKAFSVSECRHAVTKLGSRHRIRKDVQVSQISIDEIEYWRDEAMTKPDSSFSAGERTLLENIRPLQELAWRLSKPQLMLAQEGLSPKELGGKKVGSPGSRFVIRDGLICLEEGDRIFIPSQLEGVALSYGHLVCGHVGWTRLYSFMMQSYYFEGLKEKCRVISSTCHVCFVSNPSSRRLSPSHGIVASYPLEIATCDLLEIESLVGKKGHKVLVCCDYFSKAIFAYDLKSFTASAFLGKFKEFLMATGMVTKLLVVDNGTIFENKEVLSFLSLIGIRKVRGNANHSQSRGLVESSIRILQTLLRKLLALSDRYNYEDLLFLCPVLLNRAPNRITGWSPYEMLYGRDINILGPLSTYMDPPEYRLFAKTVQEDLSKLRKLITDRIDAVQDRIALEKKNYLEKVNKIRESKDPLPVGTVVFVKDYSIPRSGRARKFRPYYQKSPQVVISATETSVVTLRLADGFSSRHHPDDMLEFRSKEKDSGLYDYLPKSVMKFLGQPISSESLKELARTDSLEIIYKNKSSPVFEKMRTRSSSRNLDRDTEIAQTVTEMMTEEEESEIRNETLPKENSSVPLAPRRVQFDLGDEHFQETGDE